MLFLLVFFSFLSQEFHKHARCHKDQKQTGYKTIDTRGLCDCASKQHGTCNIAFTFRLSSDCFQCFCHCISFTDTRTNSRDQRTSCADCSSCQCDSFCQYLKIHIISSYNIYLKISLHMFSSVFPCIVHLFLCCIRDVHHRQHTENKCLHHSGKPVKIYR